MERAVIFLHEGFEEIEAITVIDILRRADIDITTVSLQDSFLVSGAHGINVEADMIFNEEDLISADMLILPGGALGTENMKKSSELNKLLKYFMDENKYIAAICAAPTVLGEAGFLNGVNAVCYPGLENELSGAVVKNDSVVTDKNIITSKGPGTAVDFALEILKIFSDEDTCSNVKNDLLL